MAAPPPPRRRRSERTREEPGGGSVGYLVAAVALIAVVVGLVIAFGVVRPPALASVADGGTRPSGGIAFVEWSSRAGCPTLTVVRPNGVRHSSDCDTGLGDLVGWTSDGIVVSTWQDSGQALRTLDPDTFATLSSAPTDVNVYAPSGDTITTQRSANGILTVYSRAYHRELWRVDAPDRYDVVRGIASPDGQWFALVDSADRLLIVPADGSSPPRVWASGIDADLWPGLVWEGTRPEIEPG